MVLSNCSGVDCSLTRVAAPNENFRRLLRTVAMLSDLGPEMTAERDFAQTAEVMLSALMHSTGAREGVLFVFLEKPSMRTSICAQGFALIPDPSVIPLLPRHVHALATAQGAVLLARASYDTFLSANGNVAAELVRCVAPLKVAGKLVGAVALCRRESDALYDEESLQYLDLLCHYVALSVHNHALTQTLTQRVADNLRLMASLHGFYDNTLEAFANAIDVKHVNIHGHSLRVGRYAAAIGDALGLDSNDVAAVRSAGYLHDIGKVAVDKGLFGNPTSLDPAGFAELAGHAADVK